MPSHNADKISQGNTAWLRSTLLAGNSEKWAKSMLWQCDHEVERFNLTSALKSVDLRIKELETLAETAQESRRPKVKMTCLNLLKQATKLRNTLIVKHFNAVYSTKACFLSWRAVKGIMHGLGPARLHEDDSTNLTELQTYTETHPEGATAATLKAMPLQLINPTRETRNKAAPAGLSWQKASGGDTRVSKHPTVQREAPLARSSFDLKQ